ncbi:MAG: chemotaxis protein CheW [Eubacteriales bacterium]|jgi:purine-binding chemotaxis protein CheW|nr:chemotaxis protein CheW [Eubacteriales bacterium]
MGDILESTAFNPEETANDRFAVFEIYGKYYGIDEKNMQEIITEAKITKVPDNPDYVLGIVNFRREIITVIDLHMLTGKHKGVAPSLRCIIVANVNGLTVGFAADNIVSLARIDKIERKKKDMAFVKGSGKINEKSVLLIDCDKLELCNLQKNNNKRKSSAP